MITCKAFQVSDSMICHHCMLKWDVNDPVQPECDFAAWDETSTQGDEAMKEYWIVKGIVTDTDAHPGARLGDTEWQFSDGPPGERSSSEDFLSLEAGFAATSPAVYHWVPEARFGVIQESRYFRVWDDQEQEMTGPLFSSADAAAAYAALGERVANEVAGTADHPGAQLARMASGADVDMVRPESPRIDDYAMVRVDPMEADHVGRLMQMLMAADDLRVLGHVLGRLKDSMQEVETVANALISLANDTDFIDARGEDV